MESKLRDAAFDLKGLEEGLQTIDFNVLPTSIPDSGPASKEIEGTDNVRFNPPMYIQRYLTVKKVLTELLKEPRNQDPTNGRTVMEVGCAEFGMHVYLKNIKELGKIIYLDLNECLLMEKKERLRPLPAEYLGRSMSRPKPLVVEAYSGDITCVDTRILLENPTVWGVIAIELIEHLVPSDLRGFEISVFGVICPDLVVITTPNSDYNTVFGMAPGTFRHDDHKFEWTREEFKMWCEKIRHEFNGYDYSLHGIGRLEAPETYQFGHVSQMAVFRKILPLLPYHIGIVKDNAFRLLESIVYPNHIETRSPEQILVDEVDYLANHVWMTKRTIEHYMEDNVTQVCYPMSHIKKVLPHSVPDVVQNMDPEIMRAILASTGRYTLVPHGSEFAIQFQVQFWDMEYNRHDDEDEDHEEMTEDDLPLPDANFVESLNSSGIECPMDDSWE